MNKIDFCQRNAGGDNMPPKQGSTRRDWYECSKCFNQGYVFPGGIPDPNKWGGCSCEGLNFTGSHDWQKLTPFQNILTDLTKYPDCFFSIQ